MRQSDNEKEMTEQFIDVAYQYSLPFKKVTPLLLMRKYKLNSDAAGKLCSKICLKRNIEAKKLAKEFLESI